MTLLPCPKCGTECSDAEDTTLTVERHTEFQFQGKTPVHDLPGKVCPECGKEFVI